MTQQQIMLNKHHSQKTNQDHTMVGSEAKNPLPTTIHKIDAMDMIGLSWIMEEDFATC
ncbi:MAG: hypothetical protein OEL84_01400 [Nitrosopumilus sp.]|nr:hypothetical protein [Nitrosopumilus sp.]